MALKDIDLKYQGGVLTTSKSLAVGGLTVAGTPMAQPNIQLPTDHGAIAWTTDPAITTGTSNAANGFVYLARMPIRTATTITKVWWDQTTGPTTPTAGQSFAGLYSTAGTLLSSVNIDGKTGNGVQNATLDAAQAVSAGYVWMALMFNAATPPVLMRGGGQTAAANVFNQTAATYRWAVNGTTTGLTALPSSITPASNSQTGVIAFWAALS
ncbi:hypothetical protein ACFYXS_02910 [Streptomyces sp. NPDC002574]|uniref:hypothetical protein n=1 Tax=Streptomyces sp. NPDC002574 TaxID=3364652 RepID=UPI0036B3B1F5